MRLTKLRFELQKALNLIPLEYANQIIQQVVIKSYSDERMKVYGRADQLIFNDKLLGGILDYAI